MLIITRKIGQPVILTDEDGNDIGHVVITKISRSEVKIGFDFHKSIRISRVDRPPKKGQRKRTQ